jgi:poly(A) polymerase
MCRHQKKFQSHGKSAAEAFHQACELVLSHQCDRIAMPRRFTSMIKEIWALQLRLEQPLRKRVMSLIQQPRFRAAYDFLLLRAQFDENLQKSADWWTDFQVADEQRREEMMNGLKSRARKRPGRHRKRPVHHAGVESKA